MRLGRKAAVFSSTDSRAARSDHCKGRIGQLGFFCFCRVFVDFCNWFFMMKQSQPQNLFELEGLEQRILLSGDPLPGIVLAGLPEEPDSMFDTDPGLSPVEDVQLSDHDYLQETSSQDSDSYDPSDEIVDIFAGLTEENFSVEESEEGAGQQKDKQVSMDAQSSQGVLENREITPEAAGAIKEGVGALADFADLLEDF